MLLQVISIPSMHFVWYQLDCWPFLNIYYYNYFSLVIDLSINSKQFTTIFPVWCLASTTPIFNVLLVPSSLTWSSCWHLYLHFLTEDFFTVTVVISFFCHYRYHLLVLTLSDKYQCLNQPAIPVTSVITIIQ